MVKSHKRVSHSILWGTETRLHCLSPPAVVQPSVGAAQIAFVDIDRLRGAHRAGRELEQRDAAEGLRGPAVRVARLEGERVAVGGERAHLRLLAILGGVVQLHREAGVVEEGEGHGGALTPRLVRVRVRVRVANLVMVMVRVGLGLSPNPKP